jgi:NTE family protein
LTSHKKNIALVLGSGGARGLAHIGIIKALEENHIPIDIVVGTSIGALIGGIYASGKSSSSMEKVVCSVDKIMVAKILIPKIFGPGFIDNKRVVEFIKKLIGDVKIENMRIPFSCVATDFITGEEVVFNKGLLADAIMASIAIPTIFQPVFLKKRYLIDGGLSNPLPISIAKEMHAQKIIAVNVSPNPKRITKKIKSKKTEEIKLLIKKVPSLFTNLLYENKLNIPLSNSEKKTEGNEQKLLSSPSMINMFLQSISISTNNLMLHHLRYAKPDILISPNIEDFDMLEFYKGPDLIKRGYDTALKYLNDIQKCVED